MAMTDEQFERFLKILGNNNTDHDLLVRMDQKIELMTISSERDRKETAIDIEKIRTSTGRAHERIDAEIRFRLLVTGSAVTIGIAISVISFILKLTGKM